MDNLMGAFLGWAAGMAFLYWLLTRPVPYKQPYAKHPDPCRDCGNDNAFLFDIDVVFTIETEETWIWRYCRKCGASGRHEKVSK